MRRKNNNKNKKKKLSDFVSNTKGKWKRKKMTFLISSDYLSINDNMALKKV